MKRSFGYLVPIQEEFHIVEAEHIVYHARPQSGHGISQRSRVHPKVYQVSEDIHCSGLETLETGFTFTATRA